MMIIGISGNPGCGKTTFSDMLYAGENRRVIHLDHIYDSIKQSAPKFMITHNVRADGNEQLFVKHNRFYRYVRHNPILSRAYNNLKYVIGRRLTLKEIERAENDNIDYLIIEGLALFNFLFPDEVDFIVRVDVNDDVRRDRILRRNTEEELKDSEVFSDLVTSFEEDITIINDGSLERLAEISAELEDYINENYYCL